MSVTKFLTPEKLFEYLDQEVADALRRHGIRSMFSYAWEGEDEPSDEFIGLAKWSVDGLQHLDYEETDGGHYSKAEHEHICVALMDLEGLMDMSALSIGQTLWLADQVKADVLGENQFFWLNHINSLTLLGMASDRVRDLFVAIYFRSSFSDYKETRKNEKLDGGRLKSGYYQYPFVHASVEVDRKEVKPESREEIKQRLASLQNLAADIYRYREHRNDTVHDIATHEARLAKQYFADSVRPRVKELSTGPHVMPTGHFRTVTKNHERAIDGAVQMSTDWYMKLVMAASYMFDIEYELRVRPRFATV